MAGRPRVAGLGGSDNHLDSRLLVRKKNTMSNKPKNGTNNSIFTSDKDTSKTRKNSVLSGAPKDEQIKKQYQVISNGTAMNGGT